MCNASCVMCYVMNLCVTCVVNVYHNTTSYMYIHFTENVYITGNPLTQIVLQSCMFKKFVSLETIGNIRLEVSLHTNHIEIARCMPCTYTHALILIINIMLCWTNYSNCDNLGVCR